MTPDKFNVRVYGIACRGDLVLVCEEIQGGREMVKFPGGGLEFGEGVEDCLKREFWEEVRVEVEDSRLFYVNHFFQQSAFNPKDQLILIYYIVDIGDALVEDGQAPGEENVRLFWKKRAELQPDQFTFPIDQEVVRRLKLETYLDETTF